MPPILPAGFVSPCQPSSVPVPLVWREGGRVRLFTRNGHDGASRYPAIAAAAAALQARSLLIDGEAVGR